MPAPMDYIDGFLQDAGLNEYEAETLIRFAAAVSVDSVDDALASFSDGAQVLALAQRTARNLYGGDAS